MKTSEIKALAKDYYIARAAYDEAVDAIYSQAISGHEPLSHIMARLGDCTDVQRLQLTHAAYTDARYAIERHGVSGDTQGLYQLAENSCSGAVRGDPKKFNRHLHKCGILQTRPWFTVTNFVTF